MSAVEIPNAVGPAFFTQQFLLKLSKICVLAALTATLIPEPSKSETLDIMILGNLCQVQDGAGGYFLKTLWHIYGGPSRSGSESTDL